MQIARRMYPKSGTGADANLSGETPVPVGAAEIAAVLDIPLDYTQQILHRLRKADVIKSVRGPRGGFLLSRSPKELSLRVVLSASEGSTFDMICEEGPVHHTCAEDGRVCGLRAVWSELKSAIDSVLEGRSVYDVMLAEDNSGSPAVFEELVKVTPHSSSLGRTLTAAGLTTGAGAGRTSDTGSVVGSKPAARS